MKDNDFSKALKFEKRCDQKHLNNEFVDEEPAKKRFRDIGGWRKCKACTNKYAFNPGNLMNILFFHQTLNIFLLLAFVDMKQIEQFKWQWRAIKKNHDVKT